MLSDVLKVVVCGGGVCHSRVGYVFLYMFLDTLFTSLP